MSKKGKFSFEVGDVYDQGIAALPPQARKDTLESLSYVVSEETYTKVLTEEELAQKKSMLAETSIVLSDLEEEKKESVAIFKARMDPYLKDKVELLNVIRHKSESKRGTLFRIDDQEEGMMYAFDEEGVCVEVRPLLKSEKQTRIKNLLTGTDGDK